MQLLFSRHKLKVLDLSKHTYLVRDNKTETIKDINWEAYNQFVKSFLKHQVHSIPVLMTLARTTYSVQSTTDNNHFTITAALHDTTSNPEAYVRK